MHIYILLFVHQGREGEVEEKLCPMGVTTCCLSPITCMSFVSFLVYRNEPVSESPSLQLCGYKRNSDPPLFSKMSSERLQMYISMSKCL